MAIRAEHLVVHLQGDDQLVVLGQEVTLDPVTLDPEERGGGLCCFDGRAEDRSEAPVDRPGERPRYFGALISGTPLASRNQQAVMRSYWAAPIAGISRRTASGVSLGDTEYWAVM